MSTNDIHLEKLDLISWISQLQDISLIEKLKKLRTKNENIEIPEWQKDVVRERIKNTKQEDYLSWDSLENQIKVD